MALQSIWFFLWGLLWALYFMTDGFDLGIGALFLILVKTDEQAVGSARTAKALAKVIQDNGPADLIFAGKQSVDSEGMQTPFRLGMELGMPVVTGVVDFALNDSEAVVKREMGGGVKQTLTVETPCIIGATKGLNEPRFPKLPAILKAKKKKIDQVDLADMGVSDGPECRIKRLEPVEERSNAKILEGSVTDMVDTLVKILKEEEKVI